MELAKRRKTPTVKVGNVLIGGEHPVVIQSMTDTPTADIEKTLAQTIELIEAGSELVRWTVNDDNAAKAVPETVKILRDKGFQTPIIGDFHFNGHTLLRKHPACARALDKYRINPGNVGRREKHDENFTEIVKAAADHNKPVRIGVNWGSLDQELLTGMMDKNARLKKPKDAKLVTYAAMMESALRSAELAGKEGLGKDKIILSVKMSILQDMVTVYSLLAPKCNYALHLGLTEAGGDTQGISSSSAALSILLQQGIGDTIRVSLTPQPGVKRSREVEVCKYLLQSMGLRYFKPSVTSCPGCGRTSSNYFQILAQDINQHIERMMPVWKKQYPGVERLKIAVMGCVVNGPGESRHADIGISLPGASEQPVAPVYVDGKEFRTLKGERIREEFVGILENHIKNKFK
ncbi:MAG: flavodoxin-dependent (E)-4-hydroxy-3-methylbut-2-enyl-diphosphate synthase [Candidatus Omnitrophota bacterium]|nr:flavodoxin-dependent (E)-4-hydroxy-3-methylbut-2-enyl-diphosphate synthase [Candidatus Omnitrophota bacterium]MDZ4241759.1 flavodoxin-dependent (E)-4-hydroxy-3-methylbut-2-enyl-diphosphate synthase [Candidatus Omnitrophota bacterium]